MGCTQEVTDTMAGVELDTVCQEEFIEYEYVIKDAKSHAQRRMQQFVNTRDAHAFTLFQDAFCSWVQLIKDVRPISKQYNNRVAELHAFVKGLRSRMDKKSELLSTKFLTTELQDLDLQKMGDHFAELRQWLHFAQEVEQIFQSWVFEESMELFQEWTGSVST